MRDVLITHHDPHCIVWVHAIASLWGVADDHDLDEPVALTEAAPVRMRYKGDCIIADRDISLKTLRAGHHAAMRFYFKSGRFLELEIPGVRAIGLGAAIVNLRLT